MMDECLVIRWQQVVIPHPINQLGFIWRPRVIDEGGSNVYLINPSINHHVLILTKEPKKTLNPLKNSGRLFPGNVCERRKCHGDMRHCMSTYCFLMKSLRSELVHEVNCPNTRCPTNCVQPNNIKIGPNI